MNKTVNIKSEALKNGLIWGIVNIVLFLVTWYVAPDLMSSYWYAGISLLMGVAFAIFFCIDMRKKVGGYWTFGEALWPIFVTFVLAMGLVFVFNILFGKYIDTSYPEQIKEMVMTKSEATLKSFGLSGEEAAKALEKTNENLEKQFRPTFSQAVMGFGISAIMYFIGAVIFALIFRRNNPNPFANQTDEQFGTN
jgi:hypothetical protein